MASRKQRGEEKKVERRKEFLFIQGSITGGDNLPSYQEAVCATNVGVVKPNSFFTETVRPLKPLLCPQGRLFAWLGIGIRNCSMSRQGGENGLQGSKIKQRRPGWAKELSVSHISPLWRLRIWIWTKERGVAWSIYTPFTPNYQTS